MKNPIALNLASTCAAVSIVLGLSLSPAQAAPKKAAGTQNITISTKGDNLAFDKATLSAKAGQAVKLTFKNKASTASGLSHNWVLVSPGKADSVGQSALTLSPETDYIPKSDDVLHHTKLLKPGESETLTFQAPSKPGDYPYICTFPGHYVSMRGVLHVK